MTLRLLRISLPLLVAAACAKPAPPPPPPPPVAPPPAAPTPAETLYTMDTRAPVPLLPMMAAHQKENMRNHLLAVQDITTALAKDDFDGVAAAASRIATSPQMTMMCNHMGMGAPGFTQQALGFHKAADGIVEAARAKDKARVLTELATTLGTCTGCHAAWKQRVVDEATWTKLTASAAPQPGMMMQHREQMQPK